MPKRASNVTLTDFVIETKGPFFPGFPHFSLLPGSGGATALDLSNELDATVAIQINIS